MKLRFAFWALALLPAAATAEMYRWVDKGGQVHYSQTRPTTGEYQQIQAAPPPAPSPNQDSLNKANDKAIKDEGKAKEQASADAKEKVARDARCKAAVERLAYLDASTARRLATTDEKGNPVRMNEETFQQERAEADKAVSKECS